jgi:hypothetical protein
LGGGAIADGETRAKNASLAILAGRERESFVLEIEEEFGYIFFDKSGMEKRE